MVVAIKEVCFVTRWSPGGCWRGDPSRLPQQYTRLDLPIPRMS
jgi:hypothetical protein